MTNSKPKIKLSGEQKEAVLSFLEYYKRFRREESFFFKRECDKMGGIFSLADYGDGNIYDDFVIGKPIKSSFPEDKEAEYKFDENGRLSLFIEGVFIDDYIKLKNKTDGQQ